jgi:ribose 5-phosphate isomerase B
MLNSKSNSSISIKTIAIGADHGGYQSKEQLCDWLKVQGYQVSDIGAHSYDPDDDYPLIAEALARAVAQRKAELGILLCRSGGGMSIAANKIKGIRAIEVFDQKSAAHAREHNHANVVTLSGDWLTLKQMQQILLSFFDAQPSTHERHIRRIEQISQLEKDE